MLSLFGASKHLVTNKFFYNNFFQKLISLSYNYTGIKKKNDAIINNIIRSHKILRVLLGEINGICESILFIIYLSKEVIPNNH